MKFKNYIIVDQLGYFDHFMLQPSKQLLIIG